MRFALTRTLYKDILEVPLSRVDRVFVKSCHDTTHWLLLYFYLYVTVGDGVVLDIML